MTLIDKLYYWIKGRKRRKALRFLMGNLSPSWQFDRSGWYWQITIMRTVKVIHDQIGNHIVYDDLKLPNGQLDSKMVSGYLKSKEEGQTFAINYIADEILLKYFPHLLK